MIATTLLLFLATPDHVRAQPKKRKGCDYLYFGMGQAPDLNAAFQCYSREKYHNDRLFLALMSLNGEGTPRDVAAARKLIEEAQVEERKHPPSSTSMESDALKKKIQLAEAAADPAKFPRVDFCRDLAGSAVMRDYCKVIQREQVKARPVEPGR